MHSTVTKLIPSRLFSVSQSKTTKMETLYPHQLRPRIYYQIGYGWRTDWLYDLKYNNSTNNN